MNVSEAVKVAKDFVTEVLKEEDVTNLGLEEVEFDEAAGQWLVTLGFSRPWNSPRDSIATAFGSTFQKRAYRVLTIRDQDGKVVSMKKRDAIDPI